MTLVIASILLLCYVVIATEYLTRINKAAVAIFAGTLCWVLYICYGSNFVMHEHQTDFIDFLGGAVPTSVAVKEYIATNVFLKYVGQAAEIVLFLLATMTIVEILDNNGCFDFIGQLLRTRRSKKMLWTLAIVTFLLSANLDNLTTTVMMLVMMRRVITSRRQRMLYGAVIVVSATCGGLLTVIGDPIGLVLWNMGAVTATNYSMSLLVPCLLAWSLTVWLIGRSLPERADCEWMGMPYRGDDTRLRPWQRLLMLFVGIGGLWFIPSFHNITKLSPFLGALCVLSVLWVVDEIVNRKLMNADQMSRRRMPQMLKYGVIQMILYVMGIMLTIGAFRETGALGVVSAWWDSHVMAWCMEHQWNDVWLSGSLAALMSAFVDSFATAMSFISIEQVETTQLAQLSANDVLGWTHRMQFVENGLYWKAIAFCSALGGNLLGIGSICALALIRMERIHIMWYVRNVGWKVLLGLVAGVAALYVFDF